MKNKIFKALYKVFYTAAVILAVLFVVIVVIGYYEYRKLILIPTINIAPFGSIVRDWFFVILLPGLVCAALGLIFQKLSKK